MQIVKNTNNGINGFTFIDEKGEYFIEINDEVNAKLKYEEIKNLEANPPKENYKILREKEYPPVQEMIVALWEDVVEGRPQEKARIQALRVEIKNKYPKN